MFRYDGRPYEPLTDLDLTTIASALVGSLEYHAMLTVVQGLWTELDERDLWTAVAERKAYLARLHRPELDSETALADAQALISRYKRESFPVLYRDEEPDADAWNGYIEFRG